MQLFLPKVSVVEPFHDENKDDGFEVWASPLRRPDSALDRTFRERWWIGSVFRGEKPIGVGDGSDRVDSTRENQSHLASNLIRKKLIANTHAEIDLLSLLSSE